MSLWMKTQQLPHEHLSQIQACYDNGGFPIEVRDVLSDWLEYQTWDLVDDTNPHNETLARKYLDALVTEIEKKIPEFHTDYFTIKIKLERAALDFKRIYSGNALPLVRTIKKCLKTERMYVDLHEGRSDYVSTENQQLRQNQERSQILQGLRLNTQETAGKLEQLKHIQESYILEVQNCNRMNEYLQKNECKTQQDQIKAVEQQFRTKKCDIQKVKKIIEEKQSELSRMHNSTFEQLNTLTMPILTEDLIMWKRSQQLYGTNAQTEEMINEIQKWCSDLAELIWENRQQIKRADVMSKQLSNPGPCSELNNLITKLLSEIVTRTFVVQVQPPQILKKDSGRFTALVTLLVGKTLNVHMNPPEVKATLISENDARQSYNNEPGNNDSIGEILNNVGTMELTNNGFMSVKFRNMQLKKIKRTDRKTCEAVTEEKFAILFKTDFKVGGIELMFSVWTLSNPVVVTVHGNQECKALATIMWDNHFAESGRTLFKVPDQVLWAKCAEMLSEKFKTDVGVSLNLQDTNYLATKIFGGTPDEDFSSRLMSWNQFCKENMKDKSFTFWEWFHAIVKLSKDHLQEFCKDSLIAGFIGKQQAQQMLLQKCDGTFLLRYSDNLLGGVTIAWVSIMENGNLNVWNLQPYDHNALKIRSLGKRVQDLNNLLYLYPDTSKADAFRRHFETEPVKTEPIIAHGYVPNTLIDTIPSVPSNTFNGQSPMTESISSPASLSFMDELGLGCNTTDYSAFNIFSMDTFDMDTEMVPAPSSN